MKNFKENIKQMKNIATKMPKSLSEAMQFEDDEIFDGYQSKSSEDELPVEKEKHLHSSQNSPVVNVEDDVENFINNTRKRALSIMAKLADDPTNKIYDISKRIWQICDKAYTEDREGQQQPIHNNNFN